MLILNPQDLKSCWWITWRPSFECSSYHTGDNLIVITIIIECPPTVQREEGGRQRYNSCWDSGTLFVYLASIFVFTLLLPGHLLECNEIYPSVKHKAWGLLIGFSSLLEYEITQNASLRLIWSHTALCGYPHKKVSIRDLSQIFTTAPILKQFHYFRQHIWVNICVQFHLYICGTSWLSVKAHEWYQTSSSECLPLTSSFDIIMWGPVEHQSQKIASNICRSWKKITNIYIFQIPFPPCWGPGEKSYFEVFS